jgi:hypothetical protein
MWLGTSCTTDWTGDGLLAENKRKTAHGEDGGMECRGSCGCGADSADDDRTCTQKMLLQPTSCYRSAMTRAERHW